MFFLLSKSLDLALSPLTWALGLLLVGAVLVARRSTRRGLTVGCLFGALGVLLVFGNPMVANRLWWSLEHDAPNSYRPEVVYDAVVLLGGVVPWGFTDPAQPPNYGDNVERLLFTYELLRTGKAGHVIISGTIPDTRAHPFFEARVLGKQLEDWGIAPERILLEEKALNTRMNAVESAKLVRERGFSSVLVVTSAFHMERSLGCFRAVDLPVDVRPVDLRAAEPSSHPWAFAPQSDALSRSTEAMRERAGRLVYRAMGYAR